MYNMEVPKMDRTMREYIAELNQNYNDLGEDLLMLEAVLYAPEGETGFPEEYMESGLLRIQEYGQRRSRSAARSPGGRTSGSPRTSGCG